MIGRFTNVSLLLCIIFVILTPIDTGKLLFFDQRNMWLKVKVTYPSLLFLYRELALHSRDLAVWHSVVLWRLLVHPLGNHQEDTELQRLEIFHHPLMGHSVSDQWWLLTWWAYVDRQLRHLVEFPCEYRNCLVLEGLLHLWRHGHMIWDLRENEITEVWTFLWKLSRILLNLKAITYMHCMAAAMLISMHSVWLLRINHCGQLCHKTRICIYTPQYNRLILISMFLSWR